MQVFDINKAKFSPAFIASIIGMLLYIFIASIKSVTLLNYHFIEAENAFEMEYPILKIHDIQASGEYAIKNNERDSIGFAKYYVSIPEDGDYYFYARCYWPDVCGNSFKILSNTNRATYLGGDAIIGKWHWVGAKIGYLTKGNNILKIESSEPYAILDKFTLCQNPSLLENLEETKNVMIDFEQDHKNAIITPANLVKDNLKSTVYNKSFHIKKEIATKKQKFLIDKKLHKDYYFMCCYKKDSVNKNSTSIDFQIYFDVINQNKYKSILLKNDSIIISEFDKNKVQILYIDNLIENPFHINKTDFSNAQPYLVSDEVHDPYNEEWKINAFVKNYEKDIKDSFSFIELYRTKDKIKVWINNNIIYEYTIELPKVSKVGFGSFSGNVLVDNIILTSDLSAVYHENFHDKAFISLVPYNSNPSYINILRKGYQVFTMENSVWYWWRAERPSGAYSFYPLVFIPDDNMNNYKNARVSMGQFYWSNYSFDLAIKPPKDDTIGVMFNYLDRNNYYKFSLINHENNNSLTYLYKVVDGLEILLGMETCTLKGFWNKLQINTINGDITVFIDDNQIYDIHDQEFTHGKIGLFTNSPSAEFGDIDIQPIDDKGNRTIPNRNLYQFKWKSDLCADLADWVYSSEDFFFLHFFTKRKNEHLEFQHKKWHSNNFNFQLNLMTLHNSKVVSGDSIWMTYKFPTNKAQYEYVLKESSLTFIKDQDTLIKSPITLEGSEIISISHDYPVWKFIVSSKENQYANSYIDSCRFDSTQIAFGIDGPGSNLKWNKKIRKYLGVKIVNVHITSE